MSVQCSFRIPTQDLGIGNYFTIPLTGKTSYKVANHYNNRSLCFAIVAFTWNTDNNSMVDNHPAEREIDLEMLRHEHIRISSATGEGYVNIKKFDAKDNSVNKGLQRFGGGFKGITGMAISSATAIKTVYDFFSSSDMPDKHYHFSITAHPTDATACTVSGEITLKELFHKINAEHGWGAPATLAEKGMALFGASTAVKEFAGGVGDTASLAGHTVSLLNGLKNYFWK